MNNNNSTTTTTSVHKPVFTIPASFLADTSLSSLAKSATSFVEKNEAKKKAPTTSIMNKSATTTTPTKTNNNNTSNITNKLNTNTSNHQFTSSTTTTSTAPPTFASKKPTTLHLITLDEKLQMSNSSPSTIKSPQSQQPGTTTTNTSTASKKKTTPKKKKNKKQSTTTATTKEDIPQIALEQSPSTPPTLKNRNNIGNDQEVLSDCEELEDRATTIVLLSARSKYSTTLTSPRSSTSLSSSVSSDDCSSEVIYQSSQKEKLLALDEEEEYQFSSSSKSTTSTNTKLKKSNQKLKKRVQTLVEEHNTTLLSLSKLQEELVSLKASYDKQLEEHKSSSTRKIDLLIDRTQHFKAKMKKTREELSQIDINVIAPLRASLEKKSAEFEAIILSMTTQFKEQRAQDESSWKCILNEKELDFTTKMELMQRQQQTTLQTELTLRSQLEKIVEARTEEVRSLKSSLTTIQQQLEHQKKITEHQELATKSREEELLDLLHQKEMENQRILRENALLKKQVETLSTTTTTRSAEAAEWKQQLAIPQRVQLDKSAPASLSVWKQVHGNNTNNNNALRGTLANFLNKC